MREKTVALSITVQEGGIVLGLAGRHRFIANESTVGDLSEALMDSRVPEAREARPADMFDRVADGLRGLFIDDADDEEPDSDSDSGSSSGGDSGNVG